VPDVMGLKKLKAAQVLQKNRLSWKFEIVPDGAEAGTVIGVTPSVGTKMLPGFPVTLKVSNGKVPMAKVPDVVGLTQAPAEATLGAAGFGVYVVEREVKPDDVGVVLAQSPAPFTELPEGSTVTITVGVGPPEPSPSPSTEPSGSPSPSPGPGNGNGHGNGNG
jgi:beta-lactam-binding protein with PASTA domain